MSTEWAPVTVEMDLKNHSRGPDTVHTLIQGSPETYGHSCL